MADEKCIYSVLWYICTHTNGGERESWAVLGMRWFYCWDDWSNSWCERERERTVRGRLLKGV